MLYLKREAQEISPDARCILEEAIGYSELGMYDDSLVQFEKIPEDEKLTRDVMIEKVKVRIHKRNWKIAFELSKLGAEIHPDEYEFIVQQIFTLFHLRRRREASRVLGSLSEDVTQSGIIHYNLACYEARLGDPEAARFFIDCAIQINPDLVRHFRFDKDLCSL